MRKIIPWLMALSIMCLAGYGMAAKTEVKLQTVLAGIDRYYESISSLTAVFDQTVEVPVLEKRERYSGKMYFRKPDLVRLEYGSPKGQLMVADGQYYWFFQPQNDIPQAMRARMDQVSSDVPRYVLGGNLAARFDVTLVGQETRGGASCFVLDLAPRKASPYYRNLRAWVDERTFATRAVRYEDESGNFNTFDLSDLRENAAIEPGKFKFSPPRGTQILDE
jgi:outer membrane lipoprotein carrier protein